VNFEAIYHEFIIPAYGDSPYLEQCVQSLVEQKSLSPITIVTSTPSNYIQGIAERHGVRYMPHHNDPGIGSDWNKALEICAAAWITIAHQDDIYNPEYSLEIKKAIATHPDANLLFSDYSELRNGKLIHRSALLMIKRALLRFGFGGREAITSERDKLRCLTFGCAIPCPAVTLRHDPAFRFSETLHVNLDWDAWIRRSRVSGSFVWVKKSLMTHRIHTGQETHQAKQSGIRHKEDLAILKTLWPRPIAQVIAKTYRLIR